MDSSRFIDPETAKMMLYEIASLRQSVRSLGDQGKQLSTAAQYDRYLHEIIGDLLRQRFGYSTVGPVTRNIEGVVLALLSGHYIWTDPEKYPTRENVQAMVDRIIVQMNEPMHWAKPEDS